MEAVSTSRTARRWSGYSAGGRWAGATLSTRSFWCPAWARLWADGARVDPAPEGGVRGDPLHTPAAGMPV